MAQNSTNWTRDLETLQSWIQAQHGRPYHRSALRAEAERLGIKSDRDFGYYSSALNCAEVHTNAGQERGYWKATGTVLPGTEIARLYTERMSRGNTPATPEVVNVGVQCPVCFTQKAAVTGACFCD